MDNLIDLFKVRMNKEENLNAARNIINTPERFGELLQVIQTQDEPTAFRAAWLLEKCVLIHPDIAIPHIQPMIEILYRPFHNGVHRSVSKALIPYPIPENDRGKLYSLCIDWLLKPEIHVAIKVNCMEIAFGIAKDTPELLEELQLVIQDQIEFNTAAFAARAKKVFKQIKKVHNR